MKWLKQYVLIILPCFLLVACKGGGEAPSKAEDVELLSYSISPDNVFVPKGQSLKLKATGVYSDGSSKDISSLVSWTLDDSSVASISSLGLMANSWAGTSGIKVVNVSAALLSQVKTAKVTITVANLYSIYVNPNPVSVSPGASQSVDVIANFSDGSSMNVTNSVSWSSSNSAIAIGNLGVISGIANGSATLTASYLSQSANLNVTVSNGASGGTTLGTGLKGDYYDGINFNSFYGTRTDAEVNFNWGTGLNNLGQPAVFSIRWTGKIKAEKSETYTLYTQSDDGVRVYIDGVLVINNWNDHATTENVSNRTFNWSADSMHDVVVEFYENMGYAVIQLKWSSATTSKQIVPQRFLYLP